MADASTYDKAIVFDESQWPLLLVKHPSEPADYESTIHYLEKLNNYFSRGEKFILAFDMSASKPPSAEHRFLVATWIKKNEHKIRPWYLGTAYYMPNFIHRLVLKTFLIFMDTTKIISPVEVFDSLESTIAWSKERIQTATTKEL